MPRQENIFKEDSMGSDFTINMNEYLPLRDLVFNTLRQAILKGELKPGERLMEIQLAEKLGVSRTPIREAIRKLELEGLVLMIPRRGAEVAKISHKSLQDVLEVRGALEELATDLACQRITEEQLIALREAENHFKAVVEKGSEMEIAEADEAYHDIIYHATGNKRLIQMINNLQAIRIRDIIRAKALMKEHIDNQEMTVSKNLNEAEERNKTAGGKR